MRILSTLFVFVLSLGAYASHIRPDGSVFFKNDFCGCKDQRSLTVANPSCDNFCKNKNTSGQERLYFNFNVGPEISHGELGNVANWCTYDIEETDTSPYCVLSAKSQNDDGSIEEQSIEVAGTIGSSGNSFYSRLEDLEYNKTYILTLIATSSAGVFKSDSIQLRKTNNGLNTADSSPLSIDPISKYACLSKAIQQGPNGLPTIVNSIKNHYYFVEKFRPDPVSPSMSLSLTCHDVGMYGSQDILGIPRLEEVSGAFHFWSQDDHRMFNLRTNESNGPGWSDAIDLEDLVRQNLASYGLGAQFKSHFSSLQATSPESGMSSPLGWYLRSFTDPSNFLAICPGEVHDTQGDYLQAIKDIIQVPTEAIYLAKRERVTYSGGAGVGCAVDDFIFVTESEMKKAWFFYKNAVPVRPGTGAAGARQILKNQMHFYYPINASSPTTRDPGQYIYTVINPSEAASSSCKLLGSLPQVESYSGAIAPHDKRFGCVPVSNP